MADLSKMLPPGPREKFIRLRDLAADRYAISRHGADEMESQRTVLHKAEIALTMYLREPRRVIEEENRLQARIAEAKAELQRIGEVRNARWQRSQPIGQLVNRIEAYVTATDPRSISLFTEALPKRAKGVSATDAIATARQEIDTLTAKLVDIDAAPFPAVEIKARAVAFVKGLAETGAPEIDALLAGADEIRWPSEFALVGDRAVQIINAPALLAWMLPDVMTKRLVGMIEEEAAEQKGAIASKDRPALRSQIHEALLLANRVEEAAISEAEARGVDIDRRGDADVRAVLGIVGSRPRDD